MNGRMARRYLFGLVFSTIVAILSAAALPHTASAAPAITSVTPRGLQIGQPTTLVITGADLSADLQLLSEAKIVSQKVKPGAKPNRVEVEIELDKATPPGLYAVRVANANGIASPIVLGVDRLPQRMFNSTIGEGVSVSRRS